MNSTTRFNRSVSWRFSVSLVIILTAVIALAWVTNRSIGREVATQIDGQMTALRDTAIESLYNWLNDRERMLLALAKAEPVKAAAQNPLAYPAASELLSRIHELFAFDSWAMVSSDGRVLLGSAASPAKAGEQLIPYLVKAQSQAIVRVPPLAPGAFGERSLLFTIAAVDGASDRFVLMASDPHNAFSAQLAIAQAGETGLTYAVNGSGMMISQLPKVTEVQQAGLIDPLLSSTVHTLRIANPGKRLQAGDDLSAKATWPFTQATAGVLAKQDGNNLYGYRNFLGQRVVGSWVWLDDYQMGIITEQSVSEAYASLNKLRTIFGLLIGIIFIATIIALLYTRARRRADRRAAEAMEIARELGQYQIDDKIGEGGMGIVYRAHHRLLQRPTAIKMIRDEEVDTENLQRFEREVRITCLLEHPNTIIVYDYGRTDDGTFYYAMELLDGTDLEELVTNSGPMPVARVINIMRQACGSLAEAHDHGLVHRDIKPANLFCCRRGGQHDVVKVLDFGLVKRVHGADKQRLTRAE